LLDDATRNGPRCATILASVITRPLDDAVRGFYARWGFQDLPFDPRRAMIVRMVDRQESFADARTTKRPRP
jgi:hypothetical protein